MDDNWLELLENYWLRIAKDTKVTLKLVQRDFKRRHLSFNDNFKDNFLQNTKSKIASSYEEFVNSSLLEEQFFGAHFTNNDIGSRAQNDQVNTEEDDKVEAESTVPSPSPHQPALHSVAIQTSILELSPSNASQATKVTLNDAIGAANQITVDEQLPEAAATPADQESHTAVESIDSISFCQCSARNCLESTSLSFFANQNTEQFSERSEKQRENVNILTTVNQSNQPPVDANNDVSFCQCSVVHGVDQTNIPTSHVEALNSEEKNIDKNINGQSSQNDENVVNAIKLEQPTTSNSETGKDVITAAFADHEQTFADLEAIISSDAEPNDPATMSNAGLLVNQIKDERMGVPLIEISSDEEDSSPPKNFTSNTQRNDPATTSDAGFCGSSESFRCLESFVAKCINSTDITASIEAMLGDGSLLVDKTNDDRMIEVVATSIEKESEAMEENSNVNTSAHEPPTNNQEVMTHDYADLNIEDQVVSANVNGEPTEDQKHSNEQGVKLDMPMTTDDTHLAEKSSANKQKLVRKRSCSPQKSGQQKKRKNLEKAITGNLNKKRKLATDSNETKQFKCEHCDFATSRKDNFNRHMLTHSDEKPFKCEICARGFTQCSNLKRHMRTHAIQFPFQCSICRQGFQLEQPLKLHEKNCNRKCYECHLCKCLCSHKGNLVKHMRIHSGETPFKCTVCARGFIQKINLKTHMRTHANQFPFHCSICRQGFSRKREKKSHEKSCNQKRFECYLCKYVSLRKEHVVRHMRKHTGTKPFRCSQCPKCFTWKPQLDIHMNRYHKK